MIRDIIKHVRVLASSAPEPESLCWIEVGNASLEDDYCPACAQRVYDWLCEGGEQPEFNEWNSYPECADIDRENYLYCEHGSYEADGARACSLCGCRLAVVLTEHGVLSEVEHFERVGINTPGEWVGFEVVCESISYVEDKDFPYKWMSEREIKLAQDLYHRVIELYKQYGGT